MAELKNRWCEGVSCHFKRTIARNPLCRLWNLRILLGRADAYQIPSNLSK
jgi:hypothetical protein